MKLAQIIASNGWDAEDPYGPPVVDIDPDDPVSKYEAFSEAVHDALQHHAAIPDHAPEALDELIKQEHALGLITSQYVGGLSQEDLLEIATAKGFEHPELAGTATYGRYGLHPLAHWLDPAGPPGPSKAMIQQKALERYEKQLAAESPEIAAVAQGTDPGGATQPTEGTWEATAEEMVQAAAQTLALAKDLKESVASGQESADQLSTLIAAENKVFTGTCAELDMDKVRAVVGGHVDQALAGSSLPGVDALAKAAHETGNLTLDEAFLLTSAETVALLRKSTGTVEHQLLKDTATSRGADLKNLYEATTALSPYKNAAKTKLQLPLLVGDDDEGTHLTDFTKAASAYCAAQSAVASWQDGVAAMAGSSVMTPAQLTADFGKWAQKQEISHLRKAASAMGLQNADKATRAKVQKWIAGAWDPAHSSEGIQASLSQMKAPSKAKQKAGKAASAAVAGSAKAPAVGVVHAGGFVAKHRDLVAALQQAKATAADLPTRHTPSEVASWTFTGGAAAHLGGMHSKSVHTAPDGSAWMFKPDKQNHGARAHAEAAASAAFHAAGVPSVPVYLKEIGKQKGSIQPLIKNAHQLPDSPSSWSQADVDAIVRFHVASWMVGDHDGKSDNVLRTPAGGLVPIDQGQAFKFFGSDQVAIDYHPNASYGAERPVFQQAYEAHLAGKLGQGVKINPAVAHPVIKAFEAITDAQWRALLSDTAHEGAKHEVAWVPAMRKRAAKSLGTPESKVTGNQIADAFLDHAVERKHGLRGAFSELFTGALKLPTGAALKDGK